MEKVQPCSSPQRSRGDMVHAFRFTVSPSEIGPWRRAGIALALAVTVAGPGCGGSGSSGPDTGIGDGGPDADDGSGMVDAGVRPDAGPPPFFDYPSKVRALDGASRNWFGMSVAATADVVVIGAPFYDLFDGTGAITEPSIGAAYVFERSGDGWTQTARLITKDEQTSAMFGWSVATNGDIIAVGAWNHGVSGSSQVGGVFVFERQSGGWIETDLLEPFSGDDQERFGYSVAMSGNRIAVGAPFIGENTDPSTPAYVFERNGDGSWSGAHLTPADGSIGGVFGYSIALSGDTAIVGAPHDGGRVGAITAGAAYVFQYDGNSWQQVDKLGDSVGEADDYFGRSVAIDGDTIAVGVENGGEPTLLGTGAVFAYQRIEGLWTAAGKLIPDDVMVGDHLGFALAVQGGRIIAGAHHHDAMGTNAGAAYVFEHDGAAWQAISKLITSDGAAGDHLGASVAVAGSTVFVGARYDDDDGADSGSIYVFERLPEM